VFESLGSRGVVLGATSLQGWYIGFDVEWMEVDVFAKQCTYDGSDSSWSGVGRWLSEICNSQYANDQQQHRHSPLDSTTHGNKESVDSV